MAMMRRIRPVFIDAVLAAALCVVDLLVSTDPSRSHGLAGGGLTPAYAAAGYLLLIWRRKYPVWVLAGMVVHSVAAWELSHGYVPTLGVWLASYTVAARCRLRAALFGLAGALLVAAVNVADLLDRDYLGDPTRAIVVSSIALSMFNLIIFGVGRWSAWTVRQRKLVADRAASDAIAIERGRIARDLHDIVAHAVTLILLQAGGAARLLRTDPDRAESALRQVDHLAQQAIVELRRMLGLLAADNEAVTEVQDDLADIADIVARAEVDNLRVRLTSSGEPVPLDAGVNVSAYRIVQEALTNVARYADRSEPVEVQLRWHTDSVEIAVTNRVRRTRARRMSTGRGLIGMRERANAANGTFSAGPSPDGRFELVVTLPTAAAIARSESARSTNLAIKGARWEGQPHAG